MRAISPRILVSLILIIIFVSHITYLNNGFTWLDHGDIEAKRSIVDLSQSADILVQPFGKTGFFRPLVTVLNSIDYALYNSFAPGYHVTNLLLHMAVVIAISFFLTAFFTVTFYELLLIMLIVGVHPIGWLPVGAISYRPELLVTFFMFLTVALHAKTRTTQSPFYAFLTLIIFLCALLAKETALVLIPALIIFWEVTNKKRAQYPFLLLYIPELLLICLYLFLHFQAVPQIWNVTYFASTWTEAVGTRIYLIERLLLQFLNPLKPGLSDAVPLMDVFSLAVILGIVIFSLFIIGIKRIKHKTSGLLVKATILFGILLTPALSLIPVPRLGSPHYGYIPLVGFAALVVLLLRLLPKKNYLVQRFAYILFGGWMIIALFTTVVSGGQFKNDLTLFTPEVAADSNFREGYFYLGNYYFLQNDLDKAENAYVHALQKNPEVVAYHDDTAASINLALLKIKQGERGDPK